MGACKLLYNFVQVLPNNYFLTCPVHTGLPNRHEAGNEYRYGFQEQEKDDEIKGEGNSYTTHFRQLDPRVGRWLSLDDLIKPKYSPYNAFRDNPLFFIDPWGDDDIFDRRGNYKGSIGKGDNIRVITGKINFKKLKEMPEKLDSYTTTIIDFTYFPSDKQNRKRLKKIAIYYGKQAGIDHRAKINFGTDNDRDDFGTPLAAWVTYPGNYGYYLIYVDIETGKIDQSLNNKWNAISVAVHEKYHEDHTKENDPNDLNHVYAIIAQAEHYSFDKLDDDFKYDMAWYSVKLLNESLAKKGVSRDEIRERINDLNNSKLGVDGGGYYLFQLDGFEVKVMDTRKVTMSTEVNVKK